MICLLRWAWPRTLSVLALLFLLISLPSHATEWAAIGPDTLSVNDYVSTGFGGFTEMLLTDEGIYGGFGEDWERIEETVNLPAIAGQYLWNDSLLVLFGDGSFSDGIYLYTGESGTFEVLEWIYLPAFIHWSENGFYVGYAQGLKYSADLETWVDLDPFHLQNVTAMASQGDLYAVCAEGGWSDGVFTSDDGGINWTGPAQEGLHFNSILPRYNETWYATYGGDSRSSGLYQSTDHGQTWTVVFYSLSMVDLHYGMYDPVIAWDGEYGDTSGVQIYHAPTSQLVSLNENLPCLNVNHLAQNDFIDCINVVACTDSGAYMTCDFPEVGVEPNPVQPKNVTLAVHPNPFNAAAVVDVVLPRSGGVKLLLYSVEGRLVADLYSGQVHAGRNRFTLDGRSVGAGMYFVVFVTDYQRIVQKVVLLK
ncbi:T9SS type A sorting domain-containing protein [bacterium]|nr:T9SS type A sorting domain-containing protein [bacterium]